MRIYAVYTHTRAPQGNDDDDDDGDCVCIPHISSLFYLSSLLSIALGSRPTPSVRDRKGPSSSLSLTFIVRLTDTQGLP